MGFFNGAYFWCKKKAILLLELIIKIIKHKPMNIKCPYCNDTLKSNEATIFGTMSGFIFVAFTCQNICFKPELGKEIDWDVYNY